MPWQRRPTAPQYANVVQQLELMLTGTSDAWLLDWLHVLGDPVWDVDALCAAGPPDDVSFGALDFASALTATNWLGKVITGLDIGDKLYQFGKQRMFAALCENTSPIATSHAGWWPILQVDYAHAANTPYGNGLAPNGVATIPFTVPVPDAATMVQIHYTQDPNLGGQMAYGLVDQDGINGTFGTLFGERIDTVCIVPGPACTQYPYHQFDGSLHLWSLDRWQSTPPVWHFRVEVNAQPQNPPGASIPPIVVTQPPSAIANTPRVYASFQDVGSRLDQLNNGLAWVLNNQLAQLARDNMPLEPSGPPFAVEPDMEYGVTLDDAGLLVTLTTPPQWSTELFGQPSQLSRVGRVTLGTVDGWFEPIPITVSPLVITPIPAGVTRVRVFVIPPLDATVTRLLRTRPAG